MKRIIAFFAALAMLLPALHIRAAAAEECVKEPEGYVWLKAADGVLPSMTFAIPGEKLPPSGIVTLKATVYFGEDVEPPEGEFGIGYVNCYSYANAEKAGNFDYLICYTDFAASIATVQLAGFNVSVKGTWADFVTEFDAGYATYPHARESSKVEVTDSRAECEVLMISVGFYNVTGTVKVACISAECEGKAIWSVDFTHGFDPANADPALYAVGFPNMDEETRDIYWGVVTGAGQPEDKKLRGDFDRDGELTESDAVTLLRHALFPETVALDRDGDIDRNGKVDPADALLTLRCVRDPEAYYYLREPELVSKGKRYFVQTGKYRTDTLGDFEDEDGLYPRYKLTDGRFAENASSVRLCAYSGVTTLLLDLIHNCELVSFTSDAFDSPSFAVTPENVSVKVSVSSNGRDFTLLGSAEPVRTEDGRTAFTLELPGVRARYVKAEIVSSGELRISEFALYGYELHGEESGSDIPRVYIDTVDSARIRKSEYVPCTVKINDPTGAFAAIEDPNATVKVRGNSTSGGAKKPYNIRFEHKQDVLGMGSAKKWYLLANMYDKTQIRNKLAFDLANDIGMSYVQQSLFVELYVNGEYVGMYQLCESIGVGESRVDIDTSGNEFLLEYEPWPQYANDEWLTTPVIGFTLGFNEPDSPTPEQREYLQTFFRGMETAVLSANYDEIAKYIDVDSFIDAFIVQEFFKQVDYSTSSTRFYIKDGKLYEGPVWDFDLSAGNASPYYYKGYNNVNGSGLSYEGDHCFGIWNGILFGCEKIREQFKARYKELQPYIINVYEDNELGKNRIDALLEKYGDDIARNYSYWSTAQIYSELEKIPEDGTYDSEINYLRDWFRNRNEWMLQRYGIN